MPDPLSRLSVEQKLGANTRALLPPGLAAFVMFGFKMAWACLFGALLLIGMILSKMLWSPDWAIHRYDAMLAYALTLQIAMLGFKLESWAEARVILLYHIVGTVMELFKTHMGSWSYPEDALFRIGAVPLFTGFLYASVGSFIARAIRLFDMRFAPFHSLYVLGGLAMAIYLNFFTHHFFWDARWALIALSIALFLRCRIWFRIEARWFWMPLTVAAGLTALFLWIAENIGTLTGTWIYKGNSGFHFAGISKFGSWYMLLFVSFALVAVEFRDRFSAEIWHPKDDSKT